MNTQRISVIIPTYYRNSALLHCLDSLQKQTRKADEIIVVDNTPDQSAKCIVKEYIQNSANNKIIYVHERNKGASYARNAGILLSHCQILAFTDDDCIVHKRWIETIESTYHKKKDVILQGKNEIFQPARLFSYIDYYFNRLVILRHIFKQKGISYLNMADTKNVAIRKSYLLKSNILFDVDLPFSEDAYLSWELKKKGILTEYCPKMIVFHNKKMTFFIF